MQTCFISSVRLDYKTPRWVLQRKPVYSPSTLISIHPTETNLSGEKLFTYVLCVIHEFYFSCYSLILFLHGLDIWREENLITLMSFSCTICTAVNKICLHSDIGWILEIRHIQTHLNCRSPTETEKKTVILQTCLSKCVIRTVLSRLSPKQSASSWLSRATMLQADPEENMKKNKKRKR